MNSGLVVFRTIQSTRRARNASSNRERALINVARTEAVSRGMRARRVQQEVSGGGRYGDRRLFYQRT